MANRGEQSGSKVVVVDLALLQSEVFRSLGKNALLVLMLFLTKRRMKMDNTRRSRWIIVNNGEIEFTYKEAENKWRIRRSTFMRALKELEAKGFIDVRFEGTGSNGSKNRYAICDRWRKWGTDRFEKPVPRKKNRRGFQKGHRRFAPHT